MACTIILSVDAVCWWAEIGRILDQRVGMEGKLRAMGGVLLDFAFVRDISTAGRAIVT